MSGTEVMPIFGVPVLAVPHRDKLRKVVVDRAQAVMHPRAKRRKFAIEHVPSRMKLSLGAMIIVRGPQRAHDRNVVDAAPHVGYPVAKFDPTVAVFSKANL